MTLPNEMIGDKGQRYIASLNGWPQSGWNAFAYGDDFEILVEACNQQRRNNPRVRGYKIHDREVAPKTDYVVGDQS